MGEAILDHWLWFALGLLLLIVEMAGAGGYLLWVGMAAGMTGGVVFPAYFGMAGAVIGVLLFKRGVCIGVVAIPVALPESG